MPELQALHDWLIETRAKTADGGASAKAIDYTLKRWSALIRYAETGHLPIDNNALENALRPIALGKKNWLSPVRNAPANARRRFRVCWRRLS